MIRKDRLWILIMIGAVFIFFTGCGRNSAADETEYVDAADADGTENITSETEKDVAFTEEDLRGDEENAERNGMEAKGVEDTGEEERPDVAERPVLPEAGGKLEDFVPENWRMMDSVELDFNEDGRSDFVGVLEADIPKASYWGYPRILFAVASAGEDNYHLEFQDINLIRTGIEGGHFDPYEPLTVEGASFTTHAWGGSAWRWSEDYTYTYRGGTWYLTASEDISYAPGDYGDYPYIIRYNDWEKGVGIRKKRSPYSENMEGDKYSEEYDIEYEVPLDPPMTIERAGKRWWLAPDRITDWEIVSVTLGKNVEISEDVIEFPEDAFIEYCDEDRVLYTFSNEDKECYYLAGYCFQDRVLSVPTRESTEIDDPVFYKGKIYYTVETVENIKYRTVADGKEQIVEKKETVGITLKRINPDGMEKETVFSFRYPEPEEDGILENEVPYMSLIYEISGDEIIVEVYLGDRPHSFYRMKTDGSGLEKIGEVQQLLADTVEEALLQIQKKNYQAALLAKGIPEERIRKYGFAFCGKKVLIGRA